MTSRDYSHEVDDIRHIFRTVAPLIIRQWKDVCRELGVAEEEIYEIERGKPWERLSEMAYQGLCVWRDREGRAATKVKLIRALRRCELKRAEEAVEGMKVRKSDNQRFRKMSPVKQRKSANGTEENGKEVRLEPSKPQPRSAGRRYSHTASSKREKWNIESDEVAAEVTASEIMSDQPVGGNWMDTYQKMVLHFYTSVVKSEDDHKRALTTLMDFKDVFVKRIMFGSLVVVIGCKSLKGLERLRQTYMSGQLEELFQTTLVQKPILQEMGVKEIFLEVYIDSSYFERCREELLSQKLARASLRSGKSSRSGRKSGENEAQNINWPETLEAVETEIASLKDRYNHFQETWREMLQGIKQVRDDTKMTSFRDVTVCHCRLKALSDSDSNGIEVFKEYTDMVHCIKQRTEELNHKLKKYRQASRAAEGPMSDIELMLHPDFPFKEDLKFVQVNLSGAEKRSYMGLLAYIPLLIAGLNKVIVTIKSSIA